jgi:hypothetical protein
MKAIAILLTAAALIVAAPARAQDTKPADVAGVWNLTVETAAGSGSPTFTFRQDGEKLEGDYEGTFGKAKVVGTIKGNDITFGFDADAQGTALKIEYKGTVDKDTMKGTVKLGDLGDGTFTGTRKK